MTYPYITMKDDTEVAFSEILTIGGKESVRIFFERPTMSGFVTAECLIPAYSWNIKGMTTSEIAALQNFVKKNEKSFFKFAKKGGVGVSA